MNPDTYMDIDEIAELIKVKKSTIYGWTSEEFIPHVKIGKLVRFIKKDIVEWLEGLKVRGRKSRLPNKDLISRKLS
jgi:excisionase family DNA binding protein